MKCDLLGLQVRVHGADGSSETFVQNDKALAARILDGVQPARMEKREQSRAPGDFAIRFLDVEMLRSGSFSLR